MPADATWPRFLESVRQIALAYNDALPDFTCQQFVQRMAKLGGMGNWQIVDQLVEEVSYRGKSEHYKVLLKDKKPLPSSGNREVGGFFSQGDFGNALRLLFSPESEASFQKEEGERLRGRTTLRCRFQVPKKHSGYDVGWGDMRVVVAYRGRCWIDLATLQVVRLECEAQEIPSSVPVRISSHTTEYDILEIAGKKYWLPVRAFIYLKLHNDLRRPQMDFYETLFGSPSPGGSIYPDLEVRNLMEYKQYQKFSAEVQLVP
jgi:hypothetical protein